MLCPFCMADVKFARVKLPNSLTSAYFCPRCNEQIPALYAQDYRKFPPIIIGAVGFPQHGKSVYFASLFYIIKELTLARDWPEFFTMGMNEDSLDTLAASVRLLEGGMLPAPTTKNFPRPTMLRAEGIPIQPDSTLLFYDTGGECFEKPTELIQFAGFVRQAKTAMFLISLTDLEDPWAGMKKLLDNYIAGMPKLGGHTKDQHLIVVYTKADKLIGRFTGRWEMLRTYLSEDPIASLAHSNGYMDRMHDISDLLLDFTAQELRANEFINVAETNFKSLSFSIISALDTELRGTQLSVDVVPRRVFDPLLWVLEKSFDRTGAISNTFGIRDLAGRIGRYIRPDRQASSKTESEQSQLEDSPASETATVQTRETEMQPETSHVPSQPHQSQSGIHKTIVLKSDEELAIMRQAGRIASGVIMELLKAIRPGLPTVELDRIAKIELAKHNATSVFLGYPNQRKDLPPFPNVVIVCVNEELSDALAGNKVLRQGDLVTLQLALYFKGFCADLAVTTGVGTLAPEAQSLLDTTREALMAGIAEAKVGNHTEDISATIQDYVENRGYSVVREYTGHGIGRNLHELPQVPNFGQRGRGVRLRKGMTIALHPIVNVGTWKTKLLDDGWTVVTADGKLSAGFKHTIAITENEPEILTMLPQKKEVQPIDVVEPSSSTFVGIRSQLQTMPFSHVLAPDTSALRLASWLRGAAAASWPLPLGLAHDLGLLLSQSANQLRLEKPVHLPFDEDTSTYLAFLQRVAEHPLVRDLLAWQPPLSDPVVAVVLARLVEGLKLPDMYRIPTGPVGVIFSRTLAAELEQVNPAQLWRDTPIEVRPNWSKILPPETLAHIESNLNRLNRTELHFLARYGPPLSGSPDPRDLLDLLALTGLPEPVRLALSQTLKLLPRVSTACTMGGVQTYPAGGYEGLTHKGSLDSLLLTELAYPEDIFIHRVLNHEALYYGREAPRERRRELAYLVVQAGLGLGGDGQVLARALLLALGHAMRQRGYEVLYSFAGRELSDPRPLEKLDEINRVLYYRESGRVNEEKVLRRVLDHLQSWREVYRGRQVLWVLSEHFDADGDKEHLSLYQALRAESGQQAWFVRTGQWGSNGEPPTTARVFDGYQVVDTGLLWVEQEPPKIYAAQLAPPKRNLEQLPDEIVLFDTHTHLQEGFDAADLDAVVQRALEAGVKWMITAGVDLSESRKAVALAERYPNVYATVGVQGHAENINQTILDELRDLTAHPRVVAIGQIGLDYYWSQANKAAQRTTFEAQLALAAEVGMPIVVAIREAYDDALIILRSWLSNFSAIQVANHPTYPGVLSTFSGDLQMAQAFLDLGFYIGVGGPITFRNARNLPSLVTQLPLDRLLLDTRSPFLSPHPFRGKRNEPAHLTLIAEKVAEFKGVSVAEVARVTTANAARLFRLQEAVQVGVFSIDSVY